ncbi:hypothetical protein L218DRAFT_281030 [Marasmius fiardii PR-910]|nr:hypothetical protein L218DRAFT_281030 [Marasmius fiardii PR-910]
MPHRLNSGIASNWHGRPFLSECFRWMTLLVSVAYPASSALLLELRQNQPGHTAATYMIAHLENCRGTRMILGSHRSHAKLANQVNRSPHLSPINLHKLASRGFADSMNTTRARYLGGS